jgi:hypothetical protein
MATGRGTMVERSPGVWRLRVYLGRDAKQRPIQTSRTFRRGRRAPQEELARFVTELADKGAPVTRVSRSGNCWTSGSSSSRPSGSQERSATTPAMRNGPRPP